MFEARRSRGSWSVLFADEFVPELRRFSRAVRLELLAQAERLRLCETRVGRPAVDALKGSRHAAMRDLRFRVEGTPWRAAFAIGPERSVVVLAAGSSSGSSMRRLYEILVSSADARYDAHLGRRAAGPGA